MPDKQKYIGCLQWNGANMHVRFRYVPNDDAARHSCIEILQVLDQNMNPVQFSQSEIKEMEKQWQKIIKKQTQS